MNTAEKILIIGGVLNVAYGLLVGLPYGALRARSSEVSKYLKFAHDGPLMQGPILLAFVLALRLSPLSEDLEFIAATACVAGATLLAGKDTLNWLTGVKDEFVEKPIGYYLGALSALAWIGGVGLIAAGVVMA